MFKRDKEKRDIYFKLEPFTDLEVNAWLRTENAYLRGVIAGYEKTIREMLDNSRNCGRKKK